MRANYLIAEVARSASLGGIPIADAENQRLKGGQINAIKAKESHRRMNAVRAKYLVAEVARSASLGGIRVADAERQRLKGGLVDAIKAEEMP